MLSWLLQLLGCQRNNDPRTPALLEKGATCRLLWNSYFPKVPFFGVVPHLSERTGASFLAHFTKNFIDLGLCSQSEYLEISETSIEESLYKLLVSLSSCQSFRALLPGVFNLMTSNEAMGKLR